MNAISAAAAVFEFGIAMFALATLAAFKDEPSNTNLAILIGLFFLNLGCSVIATFWAVA